LLHHRGTEKKDEVAQRKIFFFAKEPMAAKKKMLCREARQYLKKSLLATKVLCRDSGRVLSFCSRKKKIFSFLCAPSVLSL